MNYIKSSNKLNLKYDSKLIYSNTNYTNKNIVIRIMKYIKTHDNSILKHLKTGLVMLPSVDIINIIQNKIKNELLNSPNTLIDLFNMWKEQSSMFYYQMDKISLHRKKINTEINEDIFYYTLFQFISATIEILKKIKSYFKNFINRKILSNNLIRYMPKVSNNNIIIFTISIILLYMVFYILKYKHFYKHSFVLTLSYFILRIQDKIFNNNEFKIIGFANLLVHRYKIHLNRSIIV